MAAHSGVKIHGESSLLFALDSFSPKSRQTDANILSDWVDAWTAGDTGSSTGMSQVSAGNQRILTDNPYGATTVVWDVTDVDTTSNADGGWTTSTFDIDNSKMYRFSLWVRRPVFSGGSFYHGLYGRNSGGTNVGVYHRSNGNNYTNPYFRGGGWWGSAGVWYLVVGHVWPAGSGTGSNHPESGIYTVDGTKITSSITDFVWRDDNARSTHRTYLYYNTNTTTRQQWWNPRVEPVELPEVDSRTVKRNIPVRRLIKEGIGGRWNSRNKATESAGVVGLRSVRPVSKTSAGGGFQMGASNNDKSIQIPLAENFNKLEGTISAWVYPTSYSASNGIFVNRNDGGANSADWLWIGSWSSGGVLYFRLGQSGSCCSNDLTLSGSNSPSNIMPINKWTQVTCTWKSSGSSNIYINGVLKATRTISAIPNTSPSAYGRIGLGHVSGSSGSWDGKIDQFKIFTTQLDADTITKNYQATRARYSKSIRSGN